MNDGQTSLDEILAAATGRQASLVPETSGYLVLAIADAGSRLPLSHDDRAVLVSAEGNVSLSQRGAPIEARAAAKALRDLLARLLKVSAGSMPVLEALAVPCEESERGVEDLASQIEDALIPLNRAAARRALGRLARETMKAKESGLLPASAPGGTAAANEGLRPYGPDGAYPTSAPRVPTPTPAPSVREETPTRVMTGRVGFVSALTPPPCSTAAHDRTPTLPSFAVLTPSNGMANAILAEPTPTALGMPPVLVEDVTPIAADELGTPTRIEAITTSEAISPSPEPSAPLALANPPKPPEPTRADELIARFGVSCDNDVRAAASCLRHFAGIELTPPPASSAHRASETPVRREIPELEDIFDTPIPTTPQAKRARRSNVVLVLALLVGMLVGATAMLKLQPGALGQNNATHQPIEAAEARADNQSPPPDHAGD